MRRLTGRGNGRRGWYRSELSCETDRFRIKLSLLRSTFLDGPSLISLMVSVDVKHHVYFKHFPLSTDQDSAILCNLPGVSVSTSNLRTTLFIKKKKKKKSWGGGGGGRGG